MDEAKQQRMARAGMGASIAAAFAASICCVGPIVAVTLGITSLASLSRYEPLRPWFSAFTMISLATAFYLTYRKRSADVCIPDSACSTYGGERVQRLNRAILWFVAAITLLILTFPAWSGWLFGLEVMP